MPNAAKINQMFENAWNNPDFDQNDFANCIFGTTYHMRPLASLSDYYNHIAIDLDLEIDCICSIYGITYRGRDGNNENVGLVITDVKKMIKDFYPKIDFGIADEVPKPQFKVGEIVYSEFEGPVEVTGVRHYYTVKDSSGMLETFKDYELKSEPPERWVNLYKKDDGSISSMGLRSIFSSEAVAKDNIINDHRKYVMTVKLPQEES